MTQAEILDAIAKLPNQEVNEIYCMLSYQFGVSNGLRNLAGNLLKLPNGNYLNLTDVTYVETDNEFSTCIVWFSSEKKLYLREESGAALMKTLETLTSYFE